MAAQAKPNRAISVPRSLPSGSLHVESQRPLDSDFIAVHATPLTSKSAKASTDIAANLQLGFDVSRLQKRPMLGAFRPSRRTQVGPIENVAPSTRHSCPLAGPRGVSRVAICFIFSLVWHVIKSGAALRFAGVVTRPKKTSGTAILVIGRYSKFTTQLHTML